MNDYFGQLEQELGDAVERHARRRWYARVPLRGRVRGLAVVVVALVIATPAVGAVSGWFAPGPPDHYPIAPSRLVLGKPTRSLSRLLSLRFPDPDGGPPWGLRLVKYTGSEVCLQYGRVEDGQIGSLGIDYLWSDDHRFHPIPPYDKGAAVCTPTDADGHAFANEGDFADQASAPAGVGGQRIPASAKCPQSHIKDAIGTHRFCPAGSGRIVFVGMLGPDAKSVTYRTPTGALHTEPTVGPDGAYLIVFRAYEASCRDYQTYLGSSSDPLCGLTSGSGATLRLSTAITKISYRNGRSCSLVTPPDLASAFTRMQRRMDAVRAAKLPLTKERAELEALTNRFYKSQHMTARAVFEALNPSCPPVGWVPVKTKINEADVASAVTVKAVHAKRWCTRRHSGPNPRVIACDGRIPAGYVRAYEGEGMKRVGKAREIFFTPQVLFNISFIAREAVTRAGSGYSGFVQGPEQCGGGGGGLGFSRPLYRGFHAGERLTTQIFLPTTCAGVYQGVIRYTPAPEPGQTGGGAGPFGAPGSRVVGRFKLVVTRPR